LFLIHFFSPKCAFVCRSSALDATKVFGTPVLPTAQAWGFIRVAGRRATGGQERRIFDDRMESATGLIYSQEEAAMERSNDSRHDFYASLDFHETYPA
jgi:hypothetical protein